MPTTIDHPLSLWPSRALLTFVERHVRSAEPFVGEDRRTEERVLVAMPVIVQPVDQELKPIGKAQAMVVRDITRKGLGLVHDGPFPFKRIVVRLTHPEEGTLLAAEVRWNKALGPFNVLGCDVFKKLDRFEPFEP
jgi:hypothetical protein